MTKSFVWAEAPIMPGDLCQWFALCFEPATTHRDHPIIGPVPVCLTCKTSGVDVAEKPTDISKINQDDKTLDKAGQREKTGDPAGDALVDLANDIDNG